MKRLFLVLLGVLAGCGLVGGPYHKKDGDWYFEKYRVNVPAGETLKALNNRFAKSATAAFYRDARIPDADAASFVALTEQYAKDRRTAYFADTYRKGQEYFLILHTRVIELEGSDPATFVSLDTPHAEADLRYAKDKAHVWFEGQAFEVADVAGFAPLSYGFARDSVTGYYMRRPVPGSDGKSFVQLDNAYAKDARNFYFADVIIGTGEIVTRVVEGADRTSFAPLERGYAKDARAVYFDGVAIPGADPASFSVLEPGDAAGDARDKTGDWRDGKRAVPEPPAPPEDPNEKMGDDVGPEPIPGR